MATEPEKEYPQEIVRGTFFEHDVPIEDIFVHLRTEPGGYARPARPRRVNELIATFERPSLGVLLLSMRPNGKLACLDGHHRLLVCKHFEIKTVDAFVYIDLTVEQEAHLYRKFGENMKQTALDRFHAGLTEKLPDYLAITRLLGNLGLFIPQALGPHMNAVVAVDALLRVSKMYGFDILSRTLHILHAAWNGDNRAYRANLIMGTAAFLARFHDNPNFKSKRLIDRMERRGINFLERQAMSLKDSPLATNPNAAWGMSLVALHDQGQAEDKRLGDWPRRHYSEQDSAAKANHIRQVTANMTPEQVKAKNEKMVRTRFGVTPRSVDCPFCFATADNPCQTQAANPLATYHKARRDLARKNKNAA